MKYIKPSIEMNEAQASQLIADSLKMNTGKEVDAGGALTKDDDAWDIWGEE